MGQWQFYSVINLVRWREKLKSLTAGQYLT